MTLRVGDLNEPTPAVAARLFLDWAKRHSHLAFMASEAAERALRWGQPPEDPEGNRPTVLGELNDAFAARYEGVSRRTWVRTLRSILLTLRDQGIQVVTTLQPELVFTPSHGMSDADRRLRDIELARRPANYAAKKEFLKPIARRLAASTAAELGATFVDLTDVFDERAQYFIDYCHLSEAGSARIAEVLLPHVLERLDAARLERRS
jgi:lysophospholipase L1-like esterase